MAGFQFHLSVMLIGPGGASLFEERTCWVHWSLERKRGVGDLGHALAKGPLTGGKEPRWEDSSNSPTESHDDLKYQPHEAKF